MTILLLLHVANEDPLVIEVDELPKSTDTIVIGKHPRRRDNKEVHYILSEVDTVIFPLSRLNFIEVLPSGEDEEIFTPYRD